MITKEQARSIVQKYLRKAEELMNAFGSALPEAEGRGKLHLVILDDHTQEHEFGWVFFYDTREHHIEGEQSAALAGNAPLIVDRAEGLIYVTGTAYPLEHYLEEFKRGNRVLAEPAGPVEGP